ncbi:DNA polymerase lambda [Hyphodiscus hymeniophilus]|uniref:DNA polymerase lambda n=1 Tax=Hyphodiscus hymeniophilus TaxID=353542 RepID=A0A9P6VKS2_9HELO|nr:DNA polymerase lambda [Hyphodiscus hymeniophilus]
MTGLLWSIYSPKPHHSTSFADANKQATYEADTPLAVKESFFNQLQALNESSEEEYESNEVHETIRKCKKPAHTTPLSPRRTRTPANVKKLPALQRAISAPVSSVSIIKDTTPLPRQWSLLRKEITTPSTSSDASVIKETPPEPVSSGTRPQDRRTVSTPSIGTDLVLNHSTGIESMLGKKVVPKRKTMAPKRKKSDDDSVTLVSEEHRIFKGLVFYYFPPNDKGRLRKVRIQRVREFGAMWAQQNWDPQTVTHVIVEEKFTYESLLKHLKLESWPSNVILVNEKYPLECIMARHLHDPHQSHYDVPHQNEPAVGGKNPDVLASQTSDRSLSIKPSNISFRNGHILPTETPPRTQQSLQSILDETQSGLDTSQRVLPEYESRDGVVESPSEVSFSESQPNKRRRLTSQGDALDEMIAIQKGVEHLPLDDEEDEEYEEETSRPTSRDEPETSDSDYPRPSSRGGLKSKKKGSYSGGLNQENFSCMKGGTGEAFESDPNARVIEVLSEMQAYYERTRDRWRSYAYKRACSTLKRQRIRITNYEEAVLLPTIGHRLALKIEEIVLTNRLRRLDNAKMEPNDVILSNFMNIYDVGISQAWKWVLQGHKTLEDLSQRVHLTDNQKIGIEKYDDLLTRIPRDEVTALGDIVREAAAKLDPEVQLIIGGSYRRGAASSGDIDCLLTKAGTTASRDLLPFINELVTELTNANFLVAALAVPSENGSASKWHGCCILPGAKNPIWRRIDFLMVPATELGAALIYFTGDDVFNRSMRQLAGTKKWRLNQRGLYKDAMRGPERVKVTEGVLMVGDDEEKIFEILDRTLEVKNLASRMPESKSTDPLVWIDCEMTGLDVDNDRIIEIFCVITDANLNVLDEEGWGAVIHQSKETMDSMGEWCTNQHGETGLTAQVLESKITPEQASNELFKYIKRFVPVAKRALLAGNSVHADKAFLRKEPYTKVMEYLSYRILDVSGIKEAAKRWCEEDILKGIPKKDGLHRAKEDILDSIAEARYYQEAIFQR